MLNDEVFTRGSIAPPVSIPPQRAPADAATEVAPRPAAGRVGTQVVGWLVLLDCAALGVAHLLVGSVSLLSTVVLGCWVLALNAAGGLYRPVAAPSLLDELPGLAGRALVAGSAATVVGVAIQQPVAEGPTLAAIGFLAVAGAGRAVGYPALRRWRSTGDRGRPTIIVGGGRVGRQITAALLEHPEYGMRPVGYVDEDVSLSAADHAIPMLGGFDALPDLICRHRACDVIVTVPPYRESSLVDVLRRCDRLTGEIFVVPRLHELHGVDAGMSIWAYPLTRLRRASHRSPSWRLKRIFDIVAASIGLILLSPLMAVCAVAVYLEGGPGIIFKQERVSLDGRRFKILKFRSLTPVDEAESEQRWTIRADPRLGPVGRTLRNLSLDELPQLWNVLRGDMTLVGPRPERPYFVDEFSRNIPCYDARHRVPAGLTGWAQISGLRGDTDVSERARFDNFYIQSWSLWTDIKIVLRTAGQVLTGRRP